MRSIVAFFVGSLMVGSAAAAQAQAPAADRGYAEFVAQSAFGNVTSQSFGGEIGVTIADNVQIFVEGGRARDVSPSDLGVAAQRIAVALAQTTSGVTFRVKEPATFGLAGVRYVVQTSGSFAPYVMAGAGGANVTRDVTFAVNGSDVTANLQQYGVTLGSDLSGGETRAMLSLGADVAWRAWQRLVVDVQYRYGRIFTSGSGLNVHRAGIGLGVGF